MATSGIDYAALMAEAEAEMLSPSFQEDLRAQAQAQVKEKASGSGSGKKKKKRKAPASAVASSATSSKRTKKLSNLKAQLESCEGKWMPHPNKLRRLATNYLETRVKQDWGSQTKWCKSMGIYNSNFGNFMRKRYKDAWNATASNAYGALADFFEKEQIREKIRKIENQCSESNAGGSAFKSDLTKAEVAQLLERINAVKLGEDMCIYDDCDVIRQKIFNFLKSHPKMSQAAFLRSIGINNGSYISFRKFQGAGAGAANGTYPAAYYFFEKKRILDGEPKSVKRIENEARRPNGFPLNHDDGRSWVYVGNRNRTYS